MQACGLGIVRPHFNPISDKSSPNFCSSTWDSMQLPAMNEVRLFLTYFLGELQFFL